MINNAIPQIFATSHRHNAAICNLISLLGIIAVPIIENAKIIVSSIFIIIG